MTSCVWLFFFVARARHSVPKAAEQEPAPAPAGAREPEQPAVDGAPNTRPRVSGAPPPAPDWCVALSARQRLPIARSRRVASCRVASCRVVSLALCRVVLCFYDLLCSRRVRIWDSRLRRIVRVCSAASAALFSLPLALTTLPLPPCPRPSYPTLRNPSACLLIARFARLTNFLYFFIPVY